MYLRNAIFMVGRLIRMHLRPFLLISFSQTCNSESWVTTYSVPASPEGKISAHLVSLYLMLREMTQRNISLFGARVLCTRYSDNTYFFGPEGTVYPQLESCREHLSTVYSILVTFEQSGSTLDMLEVRVRLSPGGLGVMLCPKTWSILTRTTTNNLRWLNGSPSMVGGHQHVPCTLLLLRWVGSTLTRLSLIGQAVIFDF